MVHSCFSEELLFFASGLQLTVMSASLARPEQSSQILNLGENICISKKVLGQGNFPNHTLCLGPSRNKLFSSAFSASPSSQLPLPPSQSPSIVFIAPCSCFHLYLFIRPQWILAKPLDIEGASLAGSNFPFLSLSSPPSPPLYAPFTPVQSHQSPGLL